MAKAEPSLDLTISVVSYNAAAYLPQCLKSLLANTPPLSFELIVVDNASHDGSADLVARDFPQVRLIRNSSNLLFTKANNQAWRLAQGEFFLLCNPDTVVPADTLKTLVDFMRKHPEVGVTGPKIYDGQGEWQPSCIRSQSWLWGLCDFLLINAMLGRGRLFRHQYYLDEPMEAPGPYEVETVTAAFLLTRRSLLDEVGGMDEHYPMYFEEADLCLEARRRGLKVMYLPTVRITHLVGQATRSLPRLQVYRWLWASDLYYYKKHFSRGTYWLFRSIAFFTWPLFVLIWSARRAFRGAGQ